MNYQTILSENTDGICIITLNRPDRLNAWTYQMRGELDHAIKSANSDDNINAIVMTGAGRGFCAGADIEAVFKAQSEGEDVTSGDSVSNWVELIRESKPIVAAINGPAIGLGITQILPMDFLIASTAAKISLRFVKMGLVPELASSYFLTTRVSFGLASELMLTGKTVTADEALEIGLVDKVTAPEELLQSACDIARAMGENPQSALRQIKQLLTVNVSEQDINLVQRREGEALEKCYVSEEHKEAISAFLEKRTPDFKSARKRG